MGERATAEPGQVSQLAEACAYLPLALRVAAAQIVEEPFRSLDDYLAELRSSPFGRVAPRG